MIHVQDKDREQQPRAKTKDPRPKSQSLEARFKLRGLRWWIVGLIFLATLINYIDRLTISVLAPVITRDLGLTNTEFGGILTWFLLAYTISQGLSGKLYDRVGTKRGFVCSIVLWSIAAMHPTGLRHLRSARRLRAGASPRAEEYQ